MMLLHSLTPPEEGIHHKEGNTQAFINGKDAGKGELFITESQVTWMCQSGQGLNFEYPKICLHAISRDLSSFPEECLYLMIDGRMIEEEEMHSDSEEEDDDEPTTEVRFVPTDKGALEAMYSAMSECQALHPDPEDVDSGEEEGHFYEGEEGLEHLTEQGQANLQRYENLLNAGQGDAPSNLNGNGNIEDMENEDGEDGQGQFDDADMEQ